MNVERKNEIRSLIHTVPLLIKAHMVNQAFEAEKIIAATFELSEPLMDIIGGKIPPNHIDRIQEVYSDVLYKAFNVGIKSGEIKSKSVEVNPTLTGEDLNREIEIKMPMYFGIKKDLSLLFVDQLGDILDTVPDVKENIISQFERDLDRSYLDGVKEYLKVDQEKVDEVLETPAPEVAEESEEDVGENELDEDELIEDEEPEEEEKEEEEEEVDDEIEEELDDEEEEEEKKVSASLHSIDAVAVTALKVWDKYASKELKDLFTAQAEAGRHSDNAEMVHDFNNWLVKGETPAYFLPFEGNVKKVEDKAVLNRLEEYTRLLKDSTAEKVLKYTLGLPSAKKAQASIGSKDTITKLEAYTKLLNDPEAERVLRYRLGLPVQKVTASVDKFIGPYEVKALKEKILSTLENPKNAKVVEAGIDGVETLVIDCIAAKIDQLPEDKAVTKICSKLNTTAKNFEELEDETLNLAQQLDSALGLPGDCVFIDIGGDYCLTYSYAAVDQGVTHTLPENQGVLDVEDQKQIACLSTLSKSKTIKDISKASSKVAAYLKTVLNDIRWGRVGVVEGGNKLKASLDDIIAEVFGLDGLGYYQYLRDKR